MVVVAVFDVLEEALDDGDRDDVADILGDRPGISLERNPDDFAVLHDRAARVPGIDRGVDLDGEVLVDSAVAVGTENPGSFMAEEA